MNHYLSILCLFFLFNCTTKTPTVFSKKALLEELFVEDGTATTLQEVIAAHAGKKIVVEVWASWCRDCLVSFPRIKQLQKKYPDVQFLFLSVDENRNAWKKAIQKHKVKGLHYNLPKGMNAGNLVDFLDARWIPRYMVIGKQGEILLFNATKAIDKKILDVLQLSLDQLINQ